MDSRLRFNPGRVVVTDNAAQRLSQDDVVKALRRHWRGDRGDFAGLGQAENKLGRLRGCRLLSAYRSAEGLRFWVITEADGALTSVLLPEDFI
jgi:hypothetical protein